MLKLEKITSRISNNLKVKLSLLGRTCVCVFYFSRVQRSTKKRECKREIWCVLAGCGQLPDNKHQLDDDTMPNTRVKYSMYYGFLQQFLYTLHFLQDFHYRIIQIVRISFLFFYFCDSHRHTHYALFLSPMNRRVITIYKIFFFFSYTYTQT